MIMYLLLLLLILINISMLTLFERKILSYIQLRKGPNKIIFIGILQPLADGMKLFIKENNMNLTVNKLMFEVLPFFSFLMMFLFWTLFVYLKYEYINFSLMFFILISGLSIYGVMGSGWASNSLYALLGSFRTVAQTVSYEVGMIFIILNLLIFTKSFNLYIVTMMNKQNLYLFLGLWMLFIVWSFVILAELNRAPFDFAESESELVSGFNIEYGSGKFALFFLAEYGNIIFMCYISSMLFISNYYYIFMMMLILSTVWVRGTYPRYRYDNLMKLNWKLFLPVSMTMLLMLYYMFNQ